MALTSPCETPADLGAHTTAQDLADWATGWVAAAGCELAKRQALIQAWPK